MHQGFFFVVFSLSFVVCIFLAISHRNSINTHSFGINFTKFSFISSNFNAKLNRIVTMQPLFFFSIFLNRWMRWRIILFRLLKYIITWYPYFLFHLVVFDLFCLVKSVFVCLTDNMRCERKRKWCAKEETKNEQSKLSSNKLS